MHCPCDTVNLNGGVAIKGSNSADNQLITLDNCLLNTAWTVLFCSKSTETIKCLYVKNQRISQSNLHFVIVQ